MEFPQNLLLPLHIQDCIGYFADTLNPPPFLPAVSMILSDAGMEHANRSVNADLHVPKSRGNDDFRDTNNGCWGAFTVVRRSGLCAKPARIHQEL